MIRNIKIGIANYLLKRRLHTVERKVEMKNLSNCHSVLIIANENDDPEGLETARLVQFLKQLGKETFVYIFTQKKEESNINQHADIKVLNKTNLNRWFIPSDIELLRIMDREIDLLVDLSLAEVFPLKYIQAMSKARLKVGASMNYKKVHCDLTFDISKQENIPYLVTQIKHYLTQINNTAYVV